MKLINELLMLILMISKKYNIDIPIYFIFIIICYSFMVHSFHKAERKHKKGAKGSPELELSNYGISTSKYF